MHSITRQGKSIRAYVEGRLNREEAESLVRDVEGLIEEISTDYGIFIIKDDTLFSCEYSINPYYDINGVGLLYFASYPIISDKCFDEYYQQNYNLQTIYRDIFYFANCNSTEKIIFKLNSIEEIDNCIKTTVSLFRQSDNQILSRILTIKQKIE